VVILCVLTCLFSWTLSVLHRPSVIGFGYRGNIGELIVELLGTVVHRRINSFDETMGFIWVSPDSVHSMLPLITALRRVSAAAVRGYERAIQKLVQISQVFGVGLDSGPHKLGSGYGVD
jgi:hypothetical protein